jgi:hypothetical protein
MNPKNFLLLFTFISLQAVAQTVVKVPYTKVDEPLKKTMLVPWSDSSTELYYCKTIPDTKINGLLILLGGGGETPELLFKELKLTQLSFQNGFVTVIPKNTTMYSEKPVLQFLDDVIGEVIKEHRIPKEKVVIGGMSGGGTLALSYTEWANETGKAAAIPSIVFGVDPPVDFTEFWDRCSDEIAIDCPVSKVGIDECKWVQDDMKKRFGGTPVEVPAKYIEVSPFSKKAKEGGNTKWLKNTVVRLYTEPDIKWQMENRCRDYYQINAGPLSSMINTLRLLGNKKAELITTTGKGYRFDGSRHPHSWSIMDPDEGMKWIKENF